MTPAPAPPERADAPGPPALTPEQLAFADALGRRLAELWLADRPPAPPADRPPPEAR